ncbi:MAG: hypothetical protein GWN85_41540 [Gemmatimonadetes bacterium]|nr:hypothetical protein [Gemmatimonadota bacterium]NIR41780.1 hypothetical protein [Actinomycetota bacterium]NIS33044.1 hypothetical protein [Actinomycetota bacterium]NIT98953.1 hypothetical protein [Actinomycetota bacterium]NIU67973.1 hypothetical protein [Actinomycetota bacterium]
MLAGLATAGTTPVPMTVAGGGLAVSLALWLRNPAPLLLAMGAGYGALLLDVAAGSDPRRWVVLLAPLAFLVLERRRLFGVVIPAFLRAAWTAVRGRRSSRHRTLDEWSGS